MTHIFKTIPPPQRILLLLMYSALAALFVCALASCRDIDPPPTPEELIRGAWVRKWAPANAATNYSFDGHGQCITYAILPAQPVQSYNYAYYFEGDVLTMIDLATTPPLQNIWRAVASFPTDTTCVFALDSGIKYYLTRI